MGYAWAPQVRMVPQNGPEVTVDLLSAFTDIGGPESISLRYRQDQIDRETVNRTLRPLRFGFRPEVEMTFVITTMSEQETLATLANRLMDGGWRVFLSLDGGETERVVVMDEPPSPVPLGGKIANGAGYRLSMRCVDLIPELPFIGIGAW